MGTKIIKNDHYVLWRSKNEEIRNLNLNLEAIGSVDNFIAPLKFINGSELIDEIDLEESYVYQRGRYYREIDATEKVETSLKVVYPGIYEILIVNLKDAAVLLGAKGT